MSDDVSEAELRGMRRVAAWLRLKAKCHFDAADACESDDLKRIAEAKGHALGDAARAIHAGIVQEEMKYVEREQCTTPRSRS